MQLTAKCNVGCSWSDADGNLYQPKGILLSVPYSIWDSGAIPVPDGTASGVEIDLPFTGIVQDASMILLENETGQELNMAWGGNWFPHFPKGGVLFMAAPQIRAGGAITSWRFMLTQAQVGLGQISYTILGC